MYCSIFTAVLSTNPSIAYTDKDKIHLKHNYTVANTTEILKFFFSFYELSVTI
jgi:hypothetical protein